MHAGVEILLFVACCVITGATQTCDLPDAVACSGNGHCIADGVTEACSCEDGYLGATCQIPGHTRLECAANGTVQVAVDQSVVQWFYPGDSPVVTLQDDSCTLNLADDVYRAVFSINDCGTSQVVASGEQVTYIQTVSAVIETDPDGEMASREDDNNMHITLKCHYSASSTVEGAFTSLGLLEAGIDQAQSITFKMQIFPSAQFIQPYTAEDYPITKVVGTEVYVGISLHSREQLFMMVTSCFANESPNPFGQQGQYSLFEDGCALDETFELIEEVYDNRVHFKFQSFRTQSSPLIYLHCRVTACNDSSTCAQPSCGIGGAGRVRRSPEGSETHKGLVSSPALVLLEKRSFAELYFDFNPVQYLLGITIVGLLISAGVMVLVALLKRQRLNHMMITTISSSALVDESSSTRYASLDDPFCRL